MAEHNKCV